MKRYPVHFGDSFIVSVDIAADLLKINRSAFIRAATTTMAELVVEKKGRNISYKKEKLKNGEKREILEGIFKVFL